MKKINYIIKLTIIILSSFIAGILYTHNPWKVQKYKIIKTVLQNPKIFPFDPHRRKFIATTLKKCEALNNKTWQESTYGHSLKSAQEECLNKTISIIQKGIKETSLLDSNNGYLSTYIGGISNSIQIKATNTAELNTEQNNIYTNNLRKIIQAIPKNIPRKDTLSTIEIDKIIYYDHYAKIKWSHDSKIDYLKTKNIPYKGQF